MNRRRIVFYVSIMPTLLLAFLIVVVNPTCAQPNATAKGLASPEKLRAHVAALTGIAPARQYENLASLNQAADYIKGEWTTLGLTVEEQPYSVDSLKFKNLIVSFGPREGERVIIGAHYDVCGEKPGADDNASGVAGLIEMARLLAAHPEAIHRRIDLIAYSTEEPPYFGSHDMGSWVHAKSLSDGGVKIALMISLEMIGYYSDALGSQAFPMPVFKLFYPTKGNYVTLVGRISEWALTRRVKPIMQAAMSTPVFSANALASIPGVDWSDQRGYWELGYPALMITDTSFFRNHNYHQKMDTIDTLDFARMADVVDGVFAVVTAL